VILNILRQKSRKQNSWRWWTQNTFDRWVGAVWPVDRWWSYQPVTSSPKCLCPCTRGTLSINC